MGKEFKKWIKDKEYTWLGVPIDKEISDLISKKAYRAALEAVQDVACKGGILQNDFVIREWIRKELDERI